jgi:hypothetical protein
MLMGRILINVRMMVFPMFHMFVSFIRSVIVAGCLGMLMWDDARLIAEVVSRSEKELLGPKCVGDCEIPLLVFISGAEA